MCHPRFYLDGCVFGPICLRLLNLTERRLRHAKISNDSPRPCGAGQELESKLSLAQVIDPTTMSGEVVRFGATVKIVNEDTDEESIYQIVGEDEANVKDGKISVTSPIARAMITKEVGDAFEVIAPGGSKGYEILEVYYK